MNRFFLSASALRAMESLRQMKLYNFTANSYGPNWFVCAESRDAAIQACRDNIQQRFDEDVARLRKDAHRGGWKLNLDGAETSREYDLAHLQNCIHGEGSYKGDTDMCSIDEIEPGVVIFTEVS